MLTPPQGLEALLFAAGEPMTRKDAAKLLGVKPEQLQTVVDELSKQFTGRGLALIETEHELELRTSAEAAEIVKKLRESELTRDLGKAGLETLAVVAYQKGATRTEVDWVRGVNSSTSLRSLLLRGLVEGREDEKDRRRIRYTITPDALAHLGVARVDDLPRFAELAKQAEQIIEEENAAVAATAAQEPG